MALSGLKGITYSEFDNIVGPQLRFSYPPDVLPKEKFEPLSDFVIVGKHLCGKIILVRTDVQFLNYSVAIESPKYERNTLLFSFGFVLDLDVPPEPYESPLRKLASVMVSLEIESEFLFTAKHRLEGILETLYKSLRFNGEAFVEINEHNVLALKLFKPISPQPQEIRDDEVPVLVYSKPFMSNLPWDVSLQHLFPCIDGIRHVKRIARDAEMDADCVKRCLRVLLFYRCIFMVDIFRFTNVYQLCSPRLLNSLDHSTLFEIESFCALEVDVSPLSLPPSVQDHSQKLSTRGRQILYLLSSFRPGRTLADILCGSFNNSDSTTPPAPAPSTPRSPGFRASRGGSPMVSSNLGVNPGVTGPPSLVGIDLRRLLAIAQARGIIRRLHEYPALGRRRVSGAVSLFGEGDGDVDEDDESEGAQSSLGSSAQISIGYSTFSRPASSMHTGVNIAAVEVTGSNATSTDGAFEQIISKLDVPMLQALDGSISLDAFCCRFSVPPAAVLQHPCVYIVYQ